MGVVEEGQGAHLPDLHLDSIGGSRSGIEAEVGVGDLDRCSAIAGEDESLVGGVVAVGNPANGSAHSVSAKVRIAELDSLDRRAIGV